MRRKVEVREAWLLQHCNGGREVGRGGEYRIAYTIRKIIKKDYETSEGSYMKKFTASIKKTKSKVLHKLKGV